MEISGKVERKLRDEQEATLEVDCFRLLHYVVFKNPNILTIY